jgi:hypothetical protein
LENQKKMIACNCLTWLKIHKKLKLFDLSSGLIRKSPSNFLLVLEEIIFEEKIFKNIIFELFQILCKHFCKGNVLQNDL